MSYCRTSLLASSHMFITAKVCLDQEINAPLTEFDSQKLRPYTASSCQTEAHTVDELDSRERTTMFSLLESHFVSSPAKLVTCRMSCNETIRLS
ncbi:hypothetical protein ABBQ32_004242 [Trebouxia sp. C0010 RCD-2024]